VYAENAEAADFAWLFKPGDVLVRLGGMPVANADDFGRAMGRLLYAPGVQVRPENVDKLKPAAGSFAGEVVEVVVRRGAAQGDVTVSVPRVHSSNEQALFWHAEPLSLRRDGFPSAFAHDAPVAPELCGGPVVDRDGRVVGVNIARADGALTLAVPADVVQAVVAELRRRQPTP
jgi:S1-C subfamily serine protease